MKLFTLACVMIAATMLLVGPASAQYEQPPTIELTPPVVPPGGSVTVIVTGCSPAGGIVAIFVDGVNVGTSLVGIDGSFTTVVQVPAEAQGTVPVTARCSNGDLVSNVTVTVPNLPFQPSGTSDNGGLPRTGSEARPLLQGAAAAIVLGLGLVFLSSRRTAAHLEGEEQ